MTSAAIAVARRHNLPTQLTSFIGRQRDTSEVARLLSTARLVTVTGAGGIGKTRLALEVAMKASAQFRDGIRLVELAPLTDERLVAPTILAALGSREEPNRPLLATLVDLLDAQQSLLVLDNCEHVISACASVADTLLRECPELRILATSRQVLAVAGEVGWRVLPLTCPAPDQPSSLERLAETEAVSLFVERARAAWPAFALTDGNAAAVTLICQRLDGLPLALELAAPWVKALSVTQIVARLDDSLGLLRRTSTTAPSRQQALRATMDWSYELLSVSERALFRRLAVFTGGWTLDAAETVCSEAAQVEPTGGDLPTRPAHLAAGPSTLALLAELIDKSLVEVAEQAGAARYRFLEPIRQYAREKLGDAHEDEEFARRHRAWFTHLVEQAETEWRGERQISWLASLDAEHDNIRAALDPRGDGIEDLETVLRLAGALWWYWLMRGHLREGRARLAALLALAPPASTPTRAKALSTAGRLALVQGDYPAARSQLEASLAICRELGDREHLADALHDLGQVAHSEQDHARAQVLLEESLGLARELGDQIRVYLALDHLGELLQDLGDENGAAALYEQALDIQRRLGHRRGMVVSLTNLGSLAQRRGEHDRAEALHRESLALVVDLGDRRRTIACLEGLAAVASTRGELERAARLFGAADTLREIAGVTLPPPHRAIREPQVAAVRGALRPEVFEAAWAAGAAMSLEQAVRYALQDSCPEGPATRATPVVASQAPAQEMSESTPSTLAAHKASLTARELEVVALVTRGLTNRQIAEALVITEGTAGSHLEHILAKLGFRSRAQIAAWAVARGLLLTGPE